MKALKYLSYAGKLAGFVSALKVVPFVDPKIGVIVFAAASIIKDMDCSPSSTSVPSFASPKTCLSWSRPLRFANIGSTR